MLKILRKGSTLMHSHNEEIQVIELRLSDSIYQRDCYDRRMTEVTKEMLYLGNEKPCLDKEFAINSV